LNETNLEKQIARGIQTQKNSEFGLFWSIFFALLTVCAAFAGAPIFFLFLGLTVLCAKMVVL
jgi:hypothetical protein